MSIAVCGVEVEFNGLLVFVCVFCVCYFFPSFAPAFRDREKSSFTAEHLTFTVVEVASDG